MTAENNRKYIAEAWIDNGKEEDFKTSFLESLLDQLQHHKNDDEGEGFDADMVDGKHYCEIIQEFDDKINDLMSSFSIGKVLFSKNKKDYEITFEGVKLFIPETDGYTESDRTLPWLENPYEPQDSSPNLLEVFNSLYAKDITLNAFSAILASSSFIIVCISLVNLILISNGPSVITAPSSLSLISIKF